MTSKIKLIAGLGNPGQEYQQTRHNAGFWCLDLLADKYQANFKLQSKFQSEIAQASINDNDVWLLKPQTFMNNSGRAVQAAMSFYKIKMEEILVIHDEIDLSPGTARFKSGGGHGGQNGLRDIISCLGGNGFSRLRIGVGHPGDKHKVANYVLGRASHDEQDLIDIAVHHTVDNIPLFVAGEQQKAMNALHTVKG